MKKFQSFEKTKPVDRRKGLIKACDRLWTKIILSQDCACEYCGKAHSVYQAHHIFSKGHSWNTRYVLMNGLRLGQGCHRKVHQEKALDFADWIKEKMGEEKYLRLKLSSQGYFEKSESNLELIKNQLEQVWRQLDENTNGS